MTEENIQARVRGNILMALSNKFGSLVLSTGNKSELAAGYCTLYGDMAGGLAAIANVPKIMVYDLARYVNRAGERIPQACLEKPPSAELRPNQTDQDSLPPYEVLDAILKDYIEEALSSQEIAEKHHFDISLVRDTIRKVEWRRIQAAASPSHTQSDRQGFRDGAALSHRAEVQRVTSRIESLIHWVIDSLADLTKRWLRHLQALECGSRLPLCSADL